MPPRLKLATELVSIVKCAVVDKSNFPGTVKMGVGIFVRLPSMRCPTSVRDANVVPFGSDGAFSDELKSICIFSNRCILGNSLYIVDGRCMIVRIMLRKTSEENEQSNTIKPFDRTHQPVGRVTDGSNPSTIIPAVLQNSEALQ